METRLKEEPREADICMILEGTYPFVYGGVAHWAHDLIQRQSNLTFHLVCIQPPFIRLKQVYELPKNVIGMTIIYLQELPEGITTLKKEKIAHLFKELELPLLKLQHLGHLSDYKKIVDIFKTYDQPIKGSLEGSLGKKILIESEEAWAMTLRMYRTTMGDSSFLNFYFSWKGLLSSFYSILLAPLPLAKVYHAVSTGYAGLFLARSYLETNKPCLITEHGIYTNERRIEITLADWLYDKKSMDLSIDPSIYNRDLKDFWIDTFFGYSKLCYASCRKIITLYKGNQEYQIADGAEPSKMIVIPNGVDIEKYAAIEKDLNHPPTIALIGRVVPIKDIKTFIHATSLIREKIPNIHAYIMGPIDEDPGYYQECVDLATFLNLEANLTFTGKVNILDYFPIIDIVVLTSISESQPLAILEAGAAGIPCVATDAGSCPEIIYGTIDEVPPLGPGGSIAPLANPTAIADSIMLLLNDKQFYTACSLALQTRVKKYYNSKEVQEIYASLYKEMIQFPVSLELCYL